jgi:hypothetical protein
MLVVSPFLGDGLLDRVAAGRSPGVLVSRPESLDALKPETLARFERVFVLHPSADPEEEDGEIALPESAEPVAIEHAADAVFAGLHAKLFVMDDGRYGRLWTGSANATDAAFDRNVEFLVELAGKKRLCGIDALLGEADAKDASLRSLLVPFTPGPGPSAEELERERLGVEVERIAAVIGRLALIARAVTLDDSRFSLALEAEEAWPDLGDDLHVSCRPVTLPAGAAAPVQAGERHVAIFAPLTTEGLTQFFAFDVTLRLDALERTARFVVNVPLEGAPADRRDRVLRELLRDSKQVLRLIWLLLSDADVSVQEWVDAGTGTGTGSWRSADAGGFPILETMLQALERSPGQLDEVARLVEDLRRTPEGAALLPAGFEAIWEPIWKTRMEQR